MSKVFRVTAHAIIRHEMRVRMKERMQREFSKQNPYPGAEKIRKWIRPENFFRLIFTKNLSEFVNDMYGSFNAIMNTPLSYHEKKEKELEMYLQEKN